MYFKLAIYVKKVFLEVPQNPVLVPKTFQIAFYPFIRICLYLKSAERLENTEFKKNAKWLKRAFRALC